MAPNRANIIAILMQKKQSAATDEKSRLALRKNVNSYCTHLIIKKFPNSIKR